MGRRAQWTGGSRVPVPGASPGRRQGYGLQLFHTSILSVVPALPSLRSASPILYHRRSAAQRRREPAESHLLRSLSHTRSHGDLSRRRYTVVQGQEISLNAKLLSHVWIKNTGAPLCVAVLMTQTRFK